jgi:hypothetical protein
MITSEPCLERNGSSLRFRRLSALSDSHSRHEPINTRRYNSKHASLLAQVSLQSPTAHLTEHGTRLLGRILPASTCQSHQTNQSGALRPTTATSEQISVVEIRDVTQPKRCSSCHVMPRCHNTIILLRSLTNVRPEFAGFSPGFGPTKE